MSTDTLTLPADSDDKMISLIHEDMIPFTV